MKRLLIPALAAAALLVPALSFAKLGDTQANFEKQYGTIQPEIQFSGMDQLRRLFPDVQFAENREAKTGAGVVISLGKVVAEFHLAPDDAATLSVLKEATRVEDWDLSTHPNPLMQLGGVQTYVDKDDKFVAYVWPKQAVIVGTKAFGAETDTYLGKFALEETAKALSQQSNAAPNPSITPAPEQAPPAVDDKTFFSGVHVGSNLTDVIAYYKNLGIGAINHSKADPSEPLHIDFRTDKWPQRRVYLNVRESDNTVIDLSYAKMEEGAAFSKDEKAYLTKLQEGKGQDITKGHDSVSFRLKESKAPATRTPKASKQPKLTP